MWPARASSYREAVALASRWRGATERASKLLATLAVLWLALLVPAAAQEAGIPLSIGVGFQNGTLEGRMSVLRDPGGKLTLDDVAFGGASGSFKPIPGALAAGYTPDAFWVRLPVTVVGEAPALIIDMRPAYLDSVRVFVPKLDHPRSDADFSRIELGDHQPFAERPTLTPSLVVPLALPDNFDGSIYLRVETSSTVALRGALRSPTDMAGSATAQSLQLGLYQGIFLFTALAHLLFWLRLRDRTYLAYSAFILSQAAMSWCKSGLLPPEMLPGGGFGVDFLMGLTMCANQVFGSLFASAQTNARKHFPLAHAVFLIVAVISGLGIVMTALGYFQVIIGPALLGGLLVSVVAVVCNVKLARRGVPGSILATTAIVFQLAGTLIATLMLNAVIPYASWMDYSFETGSIFFVVYMTIALAQRTQRAEAEREQAREQTLAVARSSEQYALDLVDRRTGELAAAKDEAEAALAAEQESQQQQIRFVDVISHQYRTPLAVISSSLSALRLDLGEADEKNRDRIDRARRGIDRLVEIIEVNGHRSRLQGVAAKAERAPVALSAFMEQLVERSRDLFADRPIALELTGSTGGHVAQFDSDMIELALANLIENADKFSPAGSPVTITCALEGENLRFSVADNGIGIPSAERDLLTRKFFRASNSGGTPGLGLGLHIVKSAAAAHGGDVTIESAEGERTTVTLSVAGAGV